MVSEGLAGRFVEHVLGTPPELWEKAVDFAELPKYLPDPDVLWSADYDHPEWFFGTKSLPRWLGYTMGYEVVGQWLRQRPRPGKEEWINTSAATIFEAAKFSGG